MQKLLPTPFLLASLIMVVFSRVVYAQSVPADFNFSATVGGVAPWTEKATITVNSAGQASYIKFRAGADLSIIAESTFTVSTSDLQKLWQRIQDSSFFALSPSYGDTDVTDGVFARILITANGASHQVVVSNSAQPALQSILSTLNTAIPASFRLLYDPPIFLDLAPVDPCNLGSFSPGISPSNEFIRSTFRDPKMLARLNPKRFEIAAAPDPSHPGTVVAYDLTLQQAVKAKLANLRSKGEFFGDGVSISINDRNPPASKPISITLYLEFWGPEASRQNVEMIKNAILQRWSGLKTSTGKSVEVTVIARANPNATAPPNTPGYHQIQLLPNGGMDLSSLEKAATVNNGTVSGIWYVPPTGNPGVYAHEAGHLMGLPDRYDNYYKQPDGSWVNSRTGQSFADDDLFANYYATKYPGSNVATIKEYLQKVNLMGVPRNGIADDLMEDFNKPVLQSDIDQIAANAGLLVFVPDGSVFVNRKRTAQNLVVTHADQIFVKKGGTRTLNGIYTACVDAAKAVPDTGAVFDVTSPLDNWRGIVAAPALSQFTHYIDSAGFYCGTNLIVQEAVWRISDNALSFLSTLLDPLFHDAGISLTDQVLDFPHLSAGTSTDTTSLVIIPDELYVAAIRPRFVAGQVGVKNTLSVTVSVPADADAAPAYSWLATGPDGTTTAVTAVDSVCSLTPSRSGIYRVGLQLSVSDSVQGQRTFASSQQAYVIVPDDNTETFEHAGLTDKYPWQSFGDVPWQISNVNPQTGSFAAKAGDVQSGQASTLGVEVLVPVDTTISYSVRAATGGLVGLVFSIDSATTGVVSGLTDWLVQKHVVKAGKHRLTWTTRSSGPTFVSNVWLDNIFFPGNIVVSSVSAAGTTVPQSFELDQNYPNPFNPATTIRYGLPRTSHVTLEVFNALGQHIAQLVNDEVQAGYHEVRFDGSGLASGVYFYRLSVVPPARQDPDPTTGRVGHAGTYVDTKKLLLLR